MLNLVKRKIKKGNKSERVLAIEPERKARKKINRLENQDFLRFPIFSRFLFALGILIMAIEIIMPKLGVDMQEGEIIEWKTRG